MKNILLIQIEFLSFEEKNINSTTLKFYLPKKTMSLTIYTTTTTNPRIYIYFHFLNQISE